MSLRNFLLGWMLGLTVLASFTPTQAKANNIETKLQESFDAMVNYTPPSVHMGNRRGVISGGSLSIRTPVNTIRPFSFQAPSMSIGCGGIDIFAGAFSFISKEQLVQVMRSIVTAAITYAFKLALTTMCPKCENMMADLQSRLQSWTEFMTNTCEATRNFMDKNNISSRITDWAKKHQVDWGTKTDHAEAENRGKPNSTTLDALNNHPGIYRGMNAYGNQLWNVFTKAGQSSFGFGNNDFYEELMSITGTVIACMPEDKGCIKRAKGANGQQQGAVGQKGQIVIFEVPPIMTLNQLVEGARSEVKQYSCKDKTECMDLDQKTNNIVGFEKRIRAVFNGEGTNPGILSRIRKEPSYEPTAEELKWIRVGGSTAGTAIKLAMTNESTAKGYIDDNAKALAATIILELLEEQLNSARQAASRTDQQSMDDSIRLLIEASNRSRDQARTYYSDAAMRGQAHVAQMAMMKNQAQ